MEVIVLFHDACIEGENFSQLLGVYSTQEKADEAKQRYKDFGLPESDRRGWPPTFNCDVVTIDQDFH